MPDRHTVEFADRLLARATFGARPGDRERLTEGGSEAWLADQLRAGEAAAAAIRKRTLEALPADREERKASTRRRAREVIGERLVRAVHGGLHEVMLDFWSNHFAVDVRKGFVGALLPQYETEVLRRHALGRFEDLLLAVARSPAMLVYLDNWRSTARRDRRFDPRRGRGGINENYARELLELHTVGVDGGYTQVDVVEVARVLTGWSLERRPGVGFAFRERLHDDGPKRVLGERAPGIGQEQGERLLSRLARHPATARHIASKLVQRFVADAPPLGLVRRAERTFLETEGEIALVLRTILLSRELRDPSHRKLKTPLRFAIGALRATDGETDGARPILLGLKRLGELPYDAGTPAGYPDNAARWIDPGAMLERMSFAFALGRGSIRGTYLGPELPAGTRAVRGLSRSERAAAAIAAPEFQWA